MFLSKLKEAILCFKAGRVTLPYPFEPRVPEDGFRGRLTHDVDKCIGCSGCANVCPPRAIEVEDPCTEKRVLKFFLERCSYCGRCEEVCTEGAIVMSKEFELATNDLEDLHITAEIFMGTCQRCGRCFEPEHPLDKLMATGMRSPNGQDPDVGGSDGV